MSSKRTSSRQTHSAGHFQSTPEHKPIPQYLRDSNDSFSSVNRTGSTSVARATAAIGELDKVFSNTTSAPQQASMHGANRAHAASSSSNGAYGYTNYCHMAPNGYHSSYKYEAEPGVYRY